MKTAKVIGCGLSGVVAAILLKEKGYNVSIYEQRSHIGGNCYDSNFCGLMVHNYGPHIFHGDDDEVFNFLSRYTEWTPFLLHARGNTKLGIISLPYSKTTIEELGRELNDQEIIDVIFKDYSEKQWGIPFEDIPRTITNRMPKTKNDYNPTWFGSQKYQCIPKLGYTNMFNNMLKGIDVKLSCHPNEWKNHITDLTVFTGKIDEFYDYQFGKLEYRSLEFRHFVSDKKMDYFLENQNTKKVAYTRKYDHSHFTPDYKQNTTVITEEYPVAHNGDNIPYYPMPFGESDSIYKKYSNLAAEEKNTIFIGRLATYKYLDMSMAVKQAILKLRKI
jgi:UDP-galactopyranose mutase